jgi:hypothetical protein
MKINSLIKTLHTQSKFKLTNLTKFNKIINPLNKNFITKINTQNTLYNKITNSLIKSKLNNLFNIKKNFFSEKTEQEIEFLMTESEALLFNEHDRICILLSNNTINKKNVYNFMTELLSICVKLRKLSAFMNGWNLIANYLINNLKDFNDNDYIKYIEAFSYVNYYNEELWNLAGNEFLLRNSNFNQEDFSKLFLVIVKYQQKSENFNEGIVKILKNHNFFKEKNQNQNQKNKDKNINEKIDKIKNNDNDNAIFNFDFSNSFVILNLITENLINFYEKNIEIKNFFNEKISNELQEILKNQNFLEKLKKKDVLILLRLCGYLVNFENLDQAHKKNFIKIFENFLEKIFVFINGIKEDKKNINYLITLFIMMQDMKYFELKLNKENSQNEILEKFVFSISENYIFANDLLKFYLYKEILFLCCYKEDFFTNIISASVKKENSRYLKIGTLNVPNEDMLSDFKLMIEKFEELKNTNNLTVSGKFELKYGFYVKYFDYIGVNKEKLEEYCRNDYQILDNLSFIF